MKKQRTFYMDDKNWRKLQEKISEQGIEGRGKLERFMEKICNEVIVFFKGSGKFKIEMVK